MNESIFRRIIDVSFAGFCLALTSPILPLLAAAIWLQDFRSPIYRGVRVGQGGKHFLLLKFRSMILDAERSVLNTTSARDPRLTAAGRFIRRFKLDELLQFVNVIKGDMSVVGPRPQLLAEAALYTEAEKRLFLVKPGITDISSIVFSDLERIVANEPDPNVAYRELVRPWKSRLGLFYIDHRSLSLDAAIVFLTFCNFFMRRGTLKMTAALLRRLGAAPELVMIAARTQKLEPALPPGSRIIASGGVPPVA
jgi:lipopolysaccharide/colanic/teichoic acid biosynthesis glycosyltransferase